MGKENIDNIIKAVDKADVVSFDIFDTLIVRLTARAEDIFRIIEHKTGIKGFANARISQQTACSLLVEKTRKEPHCTFDDIYEYMEKNPITDMGEYTYKRLKETELETERELIVCNKPMQAVFEYAKSKGKKVIAVSDMYLGKKEIIPLLEGCGYSGFDNIYISADEKKTKYRLDLFEYVIENEKTEPDKIVHIGDNLKDDVENARKCGINAVLYEGCRKKDEMTLFESVCTGIVNSLKNLDKGFWYELGAMVAGPFYFAVADALLKKLENNKYDKVFFLSRDGYNLYRILKDKIPCEYLYASRRALLLCGTDSLNSETKAQLPPFTFGQTVGEILEYLDLTVKEESVKKAGFDGFDSVIREKRDFDKFKRIYDLEKEAFFDTAKRERKFLKKYFEKTGFLNSNALVFDCGWNGSSQFLLDRALSLADYKGKNEFIYVGLTDNEKCKKQLENKKYDTILFGKGKNADIWKRIERSVVLFELFFGAPHGSVRNYDDSPEGYTEESIESNFEYKKDILNGIRDFYTLAYPIFKDLGIEYEPKDCLKELFRLIENPTQREAVKIGDLENMDGFAAKKGVKKYIAKLSEDDLRKNNNELYWPQGIYAREDISEKVKKYVQGKTGVKMTVKADKTEKTENNREKNVFERVKGYIESYGFITTAFLIKNKLFKKQNKKPFDIFVENTEKDLYITEELEYKPLFSFVIPVYNVLENQLRECIDSVLNQTFDNFEIILADDKSTWESVPKVLSEYEKNEKITVIYREENGHISRCTNTAIEAAKGEYIVFMDCDDVISPNALYEFTKAVNKDKTTDFIYSDEDKLSDDGKERHFPHFKPDWSPDTFMSHMYTSHLSAYRRSIVNEIGGLRVGFEGAQDYDFTIRFTEKTNRVTHIPKILYHWRQRPESTSTSLGVKPYVKKAMYNLKKEALERRGLIGEVIYEPEVYQYRVVYEPKGEPLVSIVIPSKDNYDMLERCILSVKKNTAYKNYEFIVVDNGSNADNKAKYEQLCKSVDAEYIYKKENFNFSAMCNRGAAAAKGEYLLFLNDDTEAVSEKWLGNMLGQASLDYTGAVGAKLLYPESKRIQHCGIINLPSGPTHALLGADDSVPQYFCRNKLDYNYLAVTAACLLVSKEKFLRAGLFDEELAVGYNDVDLCFKLYENGYYNTLRTDAILFHHESVSRGIDALSEEKRKRLEGELEILNKKHPELAGKDPFYNINFTTEKTDYDINIDNYSTQDCCVITKRDLDISKYNKSRAKANIDTLSKGKITKASGWAFIAAMPLNNLNKKSLLLINENNRAIVVKTTKKLRLDVSAVFNCKSSLNLSGFDCSIDLSEIPKGRYQVGVLVENAFTFKKCVALTGRYLEV